MITVGVQPNHVNVHQEGPTTIDVEFDVHDHGDETIGYQIYYTGTTSGSVSVDASASRHIHVPIRDLVNGGLYVISVVGKSVHLMSAPVVAENSPIALSKYQWPVQFLTIVLGSLILVQCQVLLK